MLGRNHIVLLLILGLVLLPSYSAAQHRDLTIESMLSEQRVALVIGNGAYTSSPLRNPTSDARAMAQALEKAGFEVIQVLDANQLEMRRSIRDFGRKIQRGGVGLFFYAGHGMQINGRNYLIPVGTEIQAEDEVAFQSVEANEVLAKMESAGNRVNLVVLDACRNNPFIRSFRSSTRGLARMNEPTGTFLAYATGPGDVAADGDQENSPFTTAFVRHMETSGLKLEEMFKRVRAEVYNQTAEQQIPWNSSSLMGDFYFHLEEPNAPPVAQAGPNQQGFVRDTIQLDGSFSQDADGDPLRYSWRQLSGPDVQLLATDSATPRFVAQTQGAYRFGLVVSDGQEDSALDEVAIEVLRGNRPPIARIDRDHQSTLGKPVTLNGLQSSDPDGDVLNFQWTQLAGPNVALQDAETATPRFTPAEEGTYRFRLVVNDGQADSAPVETILQSASKKPGSKKWLWWVAGVGAVGAAGLVVAVGGGGDDAPPTGSLEFDIAIPSNP